MSGSALAALNEMRKISRNMNGDVMDSGIGGLGFELLRQYNVPAHARNHLLQPGIVRGYLNYPEYS